MYALLQVPRTQRAWAREKRAEEWQGSELGASWPSLPGCSVLMQIGGPVLGLVGEGLEALADGLLVLLLGLLWWLWP